MNDPVYFAIGDDDEMWLDLPRERALEWTRVFLRRRPSAPSTAMWMVPPNLEKGIPAGFSDWARRAQVAEAIGFTPASYEALHAVLDEIPAQEFAAHPDNHRVQIGLTAERPFDAERWATWNSLIASGITPVDATRRLLDRPAPRPLAAPDELASTIDLADFSFLSPAVVHAPHAGTLVPAGSLRAFTIDPDELAEQQRLLTDHGTDRIARLAGVTSRIGSRLSRLIVDVERFEGDAEEMNAVGMGALYTHGSHGQRIRTIGAAEEARLLGWFRSYGELFGDLVDRTLEHHGRAVIIDIHSYPAEPLPYELHKDDRRPELCIGVDERHTPPALVESVRSAFGGWDIEENQPFRGSYVPTRQFGDSRVSSVMLEIRRDRYLRVDGSADETAVRDIARRIQQVVTQA